MANGDPTDRPPAVQRELADFSAFCKYLKSWSGLFTGITFILPLGGYWWVDMVPPRPDGSHALLPICAVLVVSGTFFFARGTSTARATKLSRYYLGLGCVCIALYIMMLFAKTGWYDGHRVTEGWRLTDKTEKYVAQHGIGRDRQSLIEEFNATEEEQDGIWKDRWITQGILLLLGCAGAGLISGWFGLLVLNSMLSDREAGALAQGASLPR